MSETKNAGPIITTRIMRGRTVTKQEANDSVLRLINSAFQKTHDRARIGIPVRADDDDVTVMDYIEESAERVADLLKDRAHFTLLAANPEWVFSPADVHKGDSAAHEKAGGKYFDREGRIHDALSVDEGDSFLWVLPNPVVRAYREAGALAALKRVQDDLAGRSWHYYGLYRGKQVVISEGQCNLLDAAIAALAAIEQ